MPWTPNLAVGVALIDDEHKELFSRAEALFEAGRNRKSAEYIGEMLTFLDEYTKQHFADEENYMLSIRLPGLCCTKRAACRFCFAPCEAERGLRKIRREPACYT